MKSGLIITPPRISANEKQVFNMDRLNKPNINAVLDELWPLIIAGDWRVYHGLLAIPKFARLVMKAPAKWRELFTTRRKYGDYVEWTLRGRNHRDDDLPAVIYTNGDQRWYQYGELHREGDQPAFVGIDGTREWWCHDKLHRDGNRPAVIHDVGDECWVDGIRQK